MVLAAKLAPGTGDRAIVPVYCDVSVMVVFGIAPLTGAVTPGIAARVQVFSDTQAPTTQPQPIGHWLSMWQLLDGTHRPSWHSQLTQLLQSALTVQDLARHTPSPSTVERQFSLASQPSSVPTMQARHLPAVEQRRVPGHSVWTPGVQVLGSGTQAPASQPQFGGQSV